MANTYVHGKDGTVSKGGSLFNVTQFTYAESNATADVTHTGALGYQVKIKGVTKASGKLTFVYDLLNQPTVAPYDFTTGGIDTLLLKPEGTKGFSFSAIFEKLEWSSGPKAGEVSVSVDYESTGVITRPTS